MMQFELVQAVTSQADRSFFKKKPTEIGGHRRGPPALGCTISMYDTLHVS